VYLFIQISHVFVSFHYWKKTGKIDDFDEENDADLTTSFSFACSVPVIRDWAHS